MSTFEAKVYKLKIEPHPNADKLELAAVGDYRAVVQKDIYKTGDLGVYIQEGSIVPKWLLDRYGWKLAGPDANRVKAIKLRSILSQGIVVPVTSPIGGAGYSLLQREEGTEAVLVVEGQDVAAELGVTKYEPPIPVHMAGEVANAFGYTISYDIENLKKFPDIIQENEYVVVTEKLHGTWTCLGYHPSFGNIVTSKGMSGQGLVFKFNEANKDNLYVRSLRSTTQRVWLGEMIYEDQDVIERMFQLTSGLEPFYILGETFGKGVQDLVYGTDKPQFRAFDIYVGEPGKGRYFNHVEFVRMCSALGIDTVPILYVGAYSKEKILELTNGKTDVDCLTKGKSMSSILDENTLREGVVFKPVIERRDELIGRAQLKSVSDAYLLRKGEATELA